MTRSLRVLLVEDSQSDAKLVLAELRRAGFDVHGERVDDERALNAARERDWDIVLSDWDIPGFSGAGALAEVMRWTPRPPFIIVSGTVGEGVAVDAMRAGADDFVLKTNLSRLAAAVDRVLRERDERRARAHAEAQLALQDARMRALLANSRDVIGVTTAEGILTYVNPAVTAMFGYAPEELLQRSFFDVIDERDHALVAGAMARVHGREDALVSLEVRVKPRDAPSRWADFTIRNLLHDPAVRGFVGNLRDIHDRKTALDQLQASERRYRQIVETTREGVLVIDETFAISFMNQRMTELIGPAALWLGRSVLDMIHPTHVEAVVRRLEQRRAGIAGGAEAMLVDHTGEPLYVWVESTPLRDDAGNFSGALAMITDITERRRTEEALRASEAQLRHAQKMEAVGRLAGGVAHDFNNILSVMLSYSEMLLEDGNHAIRDELEEIHKAAERGAALTRQLLLFSRHQVLAPTLVEPGAVLRNMEGMLRRLVRADVELGFAIEPGAGPVRIDPGQLEQVVMNLSINARDAMPGGGTLGIEIANVELDAAFARTHLDAMPGPYVRIAVTDSGAGMSRETLARCFEPFFTTKEKGQGTGLGLSTVFGIVKNAGGTIWATSELGRGTTFELYLPRVVGGTASSLSPVKSREARGHESVLLVEDDPQVRQVASDILHRAGYQVHVAVDCDDAIEIARGPTPIDLLLSDMVMPVMSGRELAERVRQLRPAIAVLHMSGYTDETIAPGSADDALAFLQKPLQPEALMRKVREVLDARRRR